MSGERNENSDSPLKLGHENNSTNLTGKGTGEMFQRPEFHIITGVIFMAFVIMAVYLGYKEQQKKKNQITGDLAKDYPGAVSAKIESEIQHGANGHVQVLTDGEDFKTFKMLRKY